MYTTMRGDGQIHDRHRYTADGGHMLHTYTQAAHLQLHMHAATLRATGRQQHAPWVARGRATGVNTACVMGGTWPCMVEG